MPSLYEWHSDGTRLGYVLVSAGSMYQVPSNPVAGDYGEPLLNLGTGRVPSSDVMDWGPAPALANQLLYASYLNGGTKVAIRGEAPEGPGFWFPPTVLCPVSNDDRVAREEIFGPVSSVIPFRDEAEAIRLANDTIYGLSGSIWTRDGARALRVARGVEAGTLSINSNNSVRVTTPFGGFKQSGVGRELGPHALDYYTEIKNVYISTEED